MLDTIRDLYAKLDFEQNHRASEPTESTTMTTNLSPSIDIEPESLEISGIITGSSSSLVSFQQRTLDANETGGETEEDDGMILVGRPTGTAKPVVVDGGV
jgi:hypothetical protein